jgi:hypothetical protein
MARGQEQRRESWAGYVGNDDLRWANFGSNQVESDNDMTEEKTKLKRGHRRDDGLIFWASANGYETWVSPDEFIDKKAKARAATAQWRNADPLNALKSRKWAANWRKNNPQKAKESCAAWVKRNPEKAKAKQILWKSRNREKVSEAARKKYQNQKLSNPDAMREKSRLSAIRWRANNPELSKQRMREWQIKNAAKTVAYTQKRDAQRKASIPADCWESIVDGLYEIAERISRCTGIAHQVDHIWPISKGGSHCHRNLQVIPASLNRKKSARLNFNLPSCYQVEGWRAQKTTVSTRRP